MTDFRGGPCIDTGATVFGGCDHRRLDVIELAALQFDRGAAYGKRLDIPAGTAVRFEPGETKTVKLVEIAGKKVIRGGNNLANGKVSAAGKKAALKRVKAKGFATL